MKTDFVYATKFFAGLFPSDSKEREILVFLATACVGEDKAITIPGLAELFGVEGHWIQQRIIAPSRKSSAFLATGRKGVFVIETEKDAQTMIDFYENRIAAETENMNKLRALL